MSNVADTDTRTDPANRGDTSFVGRTSFDRKIENHSGRGKTERILNNDIYPIPPVINPLRREECKFDLERGLKTYYPRKFYLALSKDHKILIQKVNDAILGGGGLQAFAFPRGSGKSTIAECAVELATLYGHVKFPLLVAATGEHRREMLDSILMDFESNPLLLEDFPEVIYPIRMLNHNYLIGRYQHIQGIHTELKITNSKIALPYVQGSEAGHVIQCVSITGRMRGIKHSLPNGESIRPDIVLIDDAQTDKSAKSKVATDIRERSINGTVMGLSGPGEEITVLMPCTVIRQNDLAERFLDRENKPEWQGIRVKLLTSMPTNMQLWEKYNEIRRQSYKDGHDGKEATAFYVENQVELDKDAVASWPERYVKKKEASAIQHAMNLFFRNKVAFYSEYQNQPLIESNSDTDTDLCITREDLLTRCSGIPHGHIPRSTLYLTSGVDIQGKVLFYVTVAWSEDFGGVIADYGCYPRQGLEGLDIYKPMIPLGFDTPNLSLEPKVYAGLSALSNGILNRGFTQDDDVKASTRYVEKCLIDANWALSAPAVHAFCRDKAEANTYLPSYGRGIPSTMVPMDMWALKANEIKGQYQSWRILPATVGANRGRHASFDGNVWKNVLASRLLMPPGSPNGLLFYGSDPYKHDAFFSHIMAERPIMRGYGSRRINEWELKDGITDNHLWDCLVMAAVAAATCGLKFHTRIASDDGTKSTTDERKQQQFVSAPVRKTRTH